MPKKLTTEQFIEISKLVHSDRYDYSKVVYINNRTAVNIICPMHGEYLQKPSYHMNGSNCPECVYESKYSSIDDFIKKSNIIHNNKYNYTKSIYVNNKTKTEIECPIHGIFIQTPNMHLLGHGCNLCFIESLKYSPIEFIDKCKYIHSSLYDYSLVKYNGIFKKIKIVCKKHGIFTQKPSAHLNGQGCPKCSNLVSKKETEFLNFVKISLKNRQLKLNKYKIDGLDKKTNTIYEFLGDYWHGNPKKYNPEFLNKNNKKTFGELYKLTFKKFNELKQLGYTIKYIWESDWLRFKKRIDIIPKILTY